MAPEETKTFVLTVPEDDLDEDAAGQEATVSVTLHTVREEDLPPLDDELAMMVGDYDTLEDLRASIQEEMESAAQQQAESEYLDKVLDAMLDAADKVEYPPQAVDRETDLALSQMERNLATQGMQFEVFLNMIGKTREAYRQDLRPSAEERLRKRLVLNEIARREGLEADPEAVDEQIERMIEMAGPSGEQMREMLESPEGKLSLSEDLIIEQAQELATQIGKGEAPPLDEEEEADSEEGAEPAPEEEDAGEDVTPEAEDDAPADEAGEQETGAAPEEGEAE